MNTQEWVKKAEREIGIFLFDREIDLTDVQEGQIAAIISKHSPDVEGLVKALEAYRADCCGDAAKQYSMCDFCENAEKALAAYRKENV